MNTFSESLDLTNTLPESISMSKFFLGHTKHPEPTNLIKSGVVIKKITEETPYKANLTATDQNTSTHHTFHFSFSYDNKIYLLFFLWQWDISVKIDIALDILSRLQLSLANQVFPACCLKTVFDIFSQLEFLGWAANLVLASSKAVNWICSGQEVCQTDQGPHQFHVTWLSN